MVRMDAVLLELERAAATGLIPPGSSVLLAVSGGADSMALLHGAAESAARTGWRLSVGHVHHGWRRRAADRDLAFVADHARRLRLAFASRRRDARRAASELGLSPEAGARHVRYAALAEMAGDTGASRIATAHQREDAIESHAIALERSGGLAGLAGPRERREDGVVRPLLSVSRTQILAFLAARGIGFRRDATNGDLRLTRNRVRRALAAAPEETLAAMAREVARLSVERTRLDRDCARVLAAVRAAGGAVIADAETLARCPAQLQRVALERLAAAFARPGRAPMTGREREQIRELLASGRDFRFEAGRRIRFERRGRDLRVGPRTSSIRAAVYDRPARTATEAEAGEGAP